jgi:hypothetical protein
MEEVSCDSSVLMSDMEKRMPGVIAPAWTLETMDRC